MRALFAVVLLGLLQWVPAAQAQAPQQEPAMSEAEMRMRIELLRRSMGFGGLFGPGLQDWLNSPSAPSPGPSPSGRDNCARYNEHAARQACGSGDLWGADRIEDGRASPEERAWYDR
jgi:hypothetical protein